MDCNFKSWAARRQQAFLLGMVFWRNGKKRLAVFNTSTHVWLDLLAASANKW
jgi:hypothetical protein